MTQPLFIFQEEDSVLSSSLAPLGDSYPVHIICNLPDNFDIFPIHSLFLNKSSFLLVFLRLPHVKLQRVKSALSIFQQTICLNKVRMTRYSAVVAFQSDFQKWSLTAITWRYTNFVIILDLSQQLMSRPNICGTRRLREVYNHWVGLLISKASFFTSIKRWHRSQILMQINCIVP